LGAAGAADEMGAAAGRGGGEGGGDDLDEFRVVIAVKNMWLHGVPPLPLSIFA